MALRFFYKVLPLHYLDSLAILRYQLFMMTIICVNQVEHQCYSRDVFSDLLGPIRPAYHAHFCELNKKQGMNPPELKAMWEGVNIL